MIGGPGWVEKLQAKLALNCQNHASQMQGKSYWLGFQQHCSLTTVSWLARR
jgi:hypothetical protein